MAHSYRPSHHLAGPALHSDIAIGAHRVGGRPLLYEYVLHHQGIFDPYHIPLPSQREPAQKNIYKQKGIN